MNPDPTGSTSLFMSLLFLSALNKSVIFERPNETDPYESGSATLFNSFIISYFSIDLYVVAFIPRPFYARCERGETIWLPHPHLLLHLIFFSTYRLDRVGRGREINILKDACQDIFLFNRTGFASARKEHSWLMVDGCSLGSLI